MFQYFKINAKKSFIAILMIASFKIHIVQIKFPSSFYHPHSTMIMAMIDKLSFLYKILINNGLHKYPSAYPTLTHMKV